jgi:hypothetical protein
MKYRLSLPKPPPMSNPHHFRQLSIENTFYLQRTHLHPSVSHTTTRNSHYYPIPNTDSPYRTPPPITHTQKKTKTHTHTHTHAPTHTHTHPHTHTHTQREDASPGPDPFAAPRPLRDTTKPPLCTATGCREHITHSIYRERILLRDTTKPFLCPATGVCVVFRLPFLYPLFFSDRLHAQPQVCFFTFFF